MDYGIAFESTTDKNAKRREKQEARQQIIDKAKKDYEREEWKKEQAKIRGEDTWILPALNDRLEREQKELDKKSKKAKKERKRKKKQKKEKKRKKSESDSSSEESNDGMVWIEKTDKPSTNRSSPNVETGVVKGPQLQRDSWMESPLDLIPTTSKKEILEQKRQEKQKERNDEPNILDLAGQHQRELNPYWKDGGTGMPQEKPKKLNASGRVGDGGLSWMKRAYQRCVEQAKEEGRTLEDIATEKYGSLKKLEKMLSDAEKANQKVLQQQKEDRHYKHSERTFRNPNNDNDSHRLTASGRKDRSRSKERYRRRSRSRSLEKERSRSREKIRRKSRSKSKERGEKSRLPYDKKFKKSSRSRSKSPNDRKFRKPSRSRSRSPINRKFKKPSRSKSRSPTRKQDYRSRYPYERTSSRRERSRSPRYDRKRRSRSRSPKSRTEFGAGHNSLSSRFKRPGGSEDDEESTRSPQRSGKRFVRPGNSDEEFEENDKRTDRVSSRKSDIPAWKKKSYTNVEKNKEEKIKEIKRKEPSPSSSSSSESESSESEGSEEEEKPKVPEIKLLTEQEMNQLGAKIVRAELMGDDDLAKKLKEELETARELRERNKSEVPLSGRQQGQEDDNVVVLTRTDRQGRVIPIPEMTTDGIPSGRKRKKKQKVETHGGKGERKQYFDDDDKFDLKTLVEREKMGTAEDDSRMFARLAQRSIDKTSDDHQIDDVFLDRAAKKQSISISEMKERSQAIQDHKKMSGALEKCHFCFGNVPKHLIIAIGTKSYLCLPNHKSLTEGHCLIVPMHHSASSTVIDEDVWEEIQIFRKTLVKMFLDQDEDIVFMETSMKLKYYPHVHIECVPLPRETGDMAPIYFKKAIQESEYEWSDNKKLVDLRGRDVRKAIPKGFPYFSVDFGSEGGFAHVIEDERSFPAYFGREILGGMLDAEPQLWRKPSRENFDDQRKKVLQFAEKWKPYDWTQKLSKDDEDSS